MGALLGVSALLLLAGCDYIAETSRTYHLQHDIPDGSVLVVEQPLQVAPGRRDIYIQYGRVQPFGGIDRFYPHCEIVLRHLSDDARVLSPGRYEIFSAGPYVDRYTLGPTATQLTSLGLGGDPPPYPQLYATRMKLRGPAGSDVDEMICGELFEPAEARYPGIDDIRAVLGELARLQIVGRD